MKYYMLLMAMLLSLGMLAMPAAQAPAEAHQVTGKMTIKKLERLSGTVIRGNVSHKINRTNGTEFDGNHIRLRKLNSFIAVSDTKYGKYRPVRGTTLGEQWNRRYSSGPQRPSTKCERGRWYRAVGVHTVDQRDVWVVGSMTFHGSYKVTQHERMGPRMKC